MSTTTSVPATTTVSLGNKTFVLDREKAELAYAGKRVINGKETMFFNILPLKYQWAYDLYKTMKNNHWEPEDITMQKMSSSGVPMKSPTSSAGSSKWASATSPQQKASSVTTSYTSSARSSPLPS